MPQEKKANGGISKMDAVRDIIGNHGTGTLPTEIVRFAKSEHGLEITPGTASNYKSAVLKELRSGGKGKGQRGPRTGWRKAAANGMARKAASVSIDDIAAVKKLVEQIGAEKVEQLARVLAK